MEVSGAQAAKMIIDEVKKAVIGKDEIVKQVLMAMLAGGHILLEDIPGVGKTTLAVAFSKATGQEYNRVQFTPDTMPSDITGYTIYKKESESFAFVKGAVICNLLLADEINRASAKTQSALLQAMEEGSVTVDLKTYEIPKPFTVIATQNPSGHAGTQLLPESQLDRFVMRLSMGYPDRQHEFNMIKLKLENSGAEIRSVVNSSVMQQLQSQVKAVYVDDAIYQYAVELCVATRNRNMLSLGVSPRGTLALLSVAKAGAFIDGRDYVVPEDIQGVFCPVCAHRVILSTKARSTGVSAQATLKEILKTVAAPRFSARKR